MNSSFDVIVIGCGAVGSATLGVLAQRGVKALGLDRFPPAHDRGSSHGQSRIIRRAYFEHPDYVPLVQRAFGAWHALEQKQNVSLFNPVGLLQVGPRDGAVLQGVLKSAAMHQLNIEELTAAQVMRRFPGFVAEEPLAGVFEPGAGYLRVEACVQAALDAAVADGAQLATDETVIEWRADERSVTVQTDRDQYQARALVVSAGAWASQLLADLKLSLTVRRKPQFWFLPRSDLFRPERGTPCYLYETEAGIFYGFPQLGPEGMKVAEHTGGDVVSDPLLVDRSLHQPDVERVTSFLREFLPEAAGECTRQAVCMYTLTEDENFVIDRHPRWKHVALAAGLSGHGFKFAPALGEALADLALEQRTSLPIEFLSLARFKRR